MNNIEKKTKTERNSTPKNSFLEISRKKFTKTNNQSKFLKLNPAKPKRYIISKIVFKLRIFFKSNKRMKTFYRIKTSKNILGLRRRLE